MTLEANLTELSKINNSSQMALIELRGELKQSQTALMEARKGCEALKIDLTALRKTSEEQKALLRNANESLAASAKEAKRIKRQRALAFSFCGVFALIGALK